MPYGKSRRNYRNKSSSSAYAMAKKALQVANKSKPEKKHFKSQWSASGISDGARGGIDSTLNFVAQGTGESQRVGNQIRVTGIYGDLFFSGADACNSIRAILYVPRDPTVLLSGLAFNDAPDPDRFTILKDMLITTNANGQDCVRRKLVKKFKGGGMHTIFDGGLATSHYKNKLMFYLVSDSAIVADPTISGFVQCYYTDA